MSSVRDVDGARLHHRRILPLQIGFDRPGGELAGRVADDRGRTCKIARAGTGVAAIEHQSDVRLPRRELEDQDRQLLVGEVESIVAQAAVDENKPLVTPAEIESIEFQRPGRGCAVSAIVEDRDVAGSRLAEMLAELSDDVRTRRICVFQNDDGAIRMRLCKIGSRILDVVEAAVELGDWRWVRIDADEKRVGPWHLTPRTPKCDGRSHALLEE